tara:strand:- start:438 stop:713 length:276 start_codon:yes stop_codon:yes gene_type:complete
MEIKSSEERRINGELVHSKTVDLTDNGGFIHNFNKESGEKIAILNDKDITDLFRLEKNKVPLMKRLKKIRNSRKRRISRPKTRRRRKTNKR